MTKVWQGSYNILRKLDPTEFKMILGVIGEHGHWTIAFAQRLLQDQPVWFSNETQLIDKHRRKMAVRLLQESDCLQCLRQVDSHVLQWKPTNGCGLFLCAV
ncbi:uncharacterized protein Hap1MRO34_006989 isoform 1-T1 [Clarias gariepinus]|uniref:uncharacterized protein LOC128524663 isoform X2 n=1 Tax=Clarias gariepinus TaxID=13013 RepID=UPI00234C933E|nr:uncharacterized protein LOC128524663 isoform X2 [Clarias gariepinus]